jgi:hypothetical protein
MVGDPKNRKKLLEEKVIALILKNPMHIRMIDDLHYPLFSEKIATFLREIKKVIESKKPVEENEIEKDLKIVFDNENLDAELKNFIAALTLRADVDFEEDSQDEISLCLLSLKNIELKNRLHIISEDIKQAEKEGDTTKVNHLIEEFNKLTKEL